MNSFTLAAHELGVTQAAASRQVKHLEETLGVKLFHRLHRSIALTGEGEALYQVVAESMQRIAGVFDRLSNGAEEHELVMATTAAFSQFRLLPRLAALKRSQPGLKLRLTTQMFTSDLRHNHVDVTVRYGNGKWRDGISTLLFDEEVFPVCSPGWLSANAAPATLSELAQSALIDYDSTSEGWLTWEEWFDGLGARVKKFSYALRCSLYTDAIQAARHGQGVALGWGRLVDDLVRAGELVRLPVASLEMNDAYYIVVPRGQAITSPILALVDWLRSDLVA